MRSAAVEAPLRTLLIPLFLAACMGETEPPPPEPGPPAPAKAPEPAAAPPAPVINKPPRFKSARLVPTGFTAHQDVRAEVDVDDPDDKAVDVDYAWVVNGKELVHRRGESLPSMEYEKGDEIYVKLTASDGVNIEELETKPVTVANAPPTLLTDPGRLTKIDGFRIKATDPDGDPISWSLKGEPAGMSIDSSTGELSYAGSTDEPGGAYQITITGKDGDGGRVEWVFGIEVSAGSGAAKKGDGSD